MVYTKETELRKISPSEFLYIVKLLNDSPSPTESWAVLMGMIKLPNGDYRFTVKDREMIEADVDSRKKSAAEIFLEEWSTMGKKRPTLGLLMDLLIEAELIKVANYIAHLLGCDPPKRPKINYEIQSDSDIPLNHNNIDEVNEQQENNSINIENDIDSCQYSSSASDKKLSTSQVISSTTTTDVFSSSQVASQSYNDSEDTKSKLDDNFVQPLSSSPLSSSLPLLPSFVVLNEPVQTDKPESLSLKSTNVEPTCQFSTSNKSNEIADIEILESSEIPAVVNANDQNESSNYDSFNFNDIINSSSSNSDCGLPAILSQYNKTK